jgi:hypothetical protein
MSIGTQIQVVQSYWNIFPEVKARRHMRENLGALMRKVEKSVKKNSRDAINFRQQILCSETAHGESALKRNDKIMRCSQAKTSYPKHAVLKASNSFSH